MTVAYAPVSAVDGSIGKLRPGRQFPDLLAELITRPGDSMEQAQLERRLMRCRYLITRCAVERLGFKDLNEIKENQDAFVRECHSVLKKAQSILTQTILELESEIGRLSQKTETSSSVRKHHNWLCIMESSYEAFLWLRFGPSDVIEIYKGPKHGRLTAQNVVSVLDAALNENRDPYVFAIPLDFTRFSCIGDLLVLRRHPGRAETEFIELKEGTVNLAMIEAIHSKDPERASEFFEKYGDKGIRQVERFARQLEVSGERSELLGAASGLHKRGTGARIVTRPQGTAKHFTAEIDELCEKARRGDYAAEIFDGCLMIAALDTSSEKRYALAEFDARLLVLNAFLVRDDAATYPPARLVAELKKIKLTAWTQGFSSIFLVPPLIRELSARSLLDLSFGRIRLHCYLDAGRFLQLCRNAGLNAGFLRKKQTNRMKAAQHWGSNDYPIFDGRALAYLVGNLPVIMGSVRIHQMFFNWQKPCSVIEEIVTAVPSLSSEDFASLSGKPGFTERDLEP